MNGYCFGEGIVAFLETQQGMSRNLEDCFQEYMTLRSEPSDGYFLPDGAVLYGGGMLARRTFNLINAGTMRSLKQYRASRR